MGFVAPEFALAQGVRRQDQYAACMARPHRIQLAGVPLHIVQRGHSRNPCFFDTEDYEFYLHWLGAGLEEHGCKLHAYVLMTNHVHLLMTPSEPDGPAKLFISLGPRFVRFINRKYDKSGTLWEGRYRSSLVQSEDYLMRCHRYIELNPVRANMVEHPSHYRWSSFRKNALGEHNPLITQHPLYTALASLEPARQAAYLDLFQEQLTPDVLFDIRRALNHGKPLGNGSFLSAVEDITSQQCRIVDRGRPRRTDEK
jgi:putative transposase